MSKRQELFASIGVGIAGIATWALLVAFLATRLSYPGVV
ncbi:MAG: hypothetical protein RL434_2959 [Pseudomonadota bacterium]|jgi:hypothetical protein